MKIDFSKTEVIDTLKKLGYEIVQVNETSIRSRRKIWDKSDKDYVLINNEHKSIWEIFKLEILKSLTK